MTDTLETKLVKWNHFDRLTMCFRNDPRRFLVTDSSAGVANQQMSMLDILAFWDAGLEGNTEMVAMLKILEACSAMLVDDCKEVEGWEIERVA